MRIEPIKMHGKAQQHAQQADGGVAQQGAGGVVVAQRMG